MIAIIDYGMGNLRSVGKALEFVGANVVVTKSPNRILYADAAVFPGVGAFGQARKNIYSYKLNDVIRKAVFENKPFLGLCLGFQLLFDFSREDGTHKGLGVIQGHVDRFNFTNKKLKVPHMGWNRVKIKNETAQNKMFKGIKNESYFYFVHSYYGKPKEDSYISSTTEYGIDFCSSITKGKIWACQFHPEKSGTNGLKLLKNFVGLIC
ncbi:MAG: imidazole glycerol phosphate synthase subunit HisH [Elusimicrobia bacterium]|nr:imidazole glycerol phosphate synthase subunit HisH [Candidatus Liberimonas magnetica]